MRYHHDVSRTFVLAFFAAMVGLAAPTLSCAPHRHTAADSQTNTDKTASYPPASSTQQHDPQVAASEVSPAADSSAEAVVDIVAALPEVRAYCDSLERARQPVHCTLFLVERPEGDCPVQVSPWDDCLWGLYVGEAHADHTVRWATFRVQLSERTIAGVDDAMCGTMKLEAWRAWRKRFQPGKEPPECPTSPAP